MKARSFPLVLAALGVTGLTALAVAQDRDQDPARGARETTRAQDVDGRSIEEARQRFQEHVLQKIQTAARARQTLIDPRALTISLFGAKGMIAGAPVPFDLGEGAGRTGETQPGRPGEANRGASKGEVVGILLATDALVSADDVRTQPGRTGQPGQGNQPAHMRATTYKTFDLRLKEGSQQVELVDAAGQVVMTVPLLDVDMKRRPGMGKPVEAGSERQPGGERQDGGEQGAGEGQRGRGEERAGQGGRLDATAVLANERWKQVYASVAIHLMRDDSF